jgi:hypothetical protein
MSHRHVLIEAKDGEDSKSSHHLVAIFPFVCAQKSAVLLFPGTNNRRVYFPTERVCSHMERVCSHTEGVYSHTERGPSNKER